jgi:tetratricopeptide (TPR) repeat protein
MSSYRGAILLPTLLSALLLLLTPGQAQEVGVNARNLVKLARSAADAKDWAKARDYASQALQEEGGYLDAYYMRAFAYRMLGEKKKAEEDFREVIRRDAKFLPTYGALADMYLADKEWDKAEKVFSELGQQDNGAKWASYYRGVMAYQRGDLQKAEAQWKDALSKDVNFASASHNLGVICLAKKDYPRSLSYFTDALEQKPESAMYRFHLAWGCEKTGQVPKALDNLKRIMNEGADDQRFWLLAKAYDHLLRGQNDNALKLLETVTRDYPETLDGWVLKGRALLASGQPEQAREALTKAKELDPLFVETHDLLARLPAPPKPAPSEAPLPKQQNAPTATEQPEAAPAQPPTPSEANQE